MKYLLVVYVATWPEPSRIWSRTAFSIELCESLLDAAA